MPAWVFWAHSTIPACLPTCTYFSGFLLDFWIIYIVRFLPGSAGFVLGLDYGFSCLPAELCPGYRCRYLPPGYLQFVYVLPACWVPAVAGRCSCLQTLFPACWNYRSGYLHRFCHLHLRFVSACHLRSGLPGSAVFCLPLHLGFCTCRYLPPPACSAAVPLTGCISGAACADACLPVFWREWIPVLGLMGGCRSGCTTTWREILVLQIPPFLHWRFHHLVAGPYTCWVLVSATCISTATLRFWVLHHGALFWRSGRREITVSFYYLPASGNFVLHSPLLNSHSHSDSDHSYIHLFCCVHHLPTGPTMTGGLPPAPFLILTAPCHLPAISPGASCILLSFHSFSDACILPFYIFTGRLPTWVPFVLIPFLIQYLHLHLPRFTPRTILSCTIVLHRHLLFLPFSGLLGACWAFLSPPARFLEEDFMAVRSGGSWVGLLGGDSGSCLEVLGATCLLLPQITWVWVVAFSPAGCLLHSCLPPAMGLCCIYSYLGFLQISADSAPACLPVYLDAVLDSAAGFIGCVLPPGCLPLGLPAGFLP